MYSMKALVLILTVIWNLSLMCGVQAQCTVGPPPTGFIITSTEALSDEVADQGTITYGCDTDYTSDGADGTVTCDGTTWTGPTLTCKGCPAPALDSSMERTPATAADAIVADSTALTYTCKSGYGKSAANEVINCNGNSWSSAVTLKCGCEAPTLASTMERTPTTADGGIIAHSGTLTYTCKTGYTNSAANQVATCTGSTNTWNPHPLTLTCKGCAAPVLDSKMKRTPETTDGAILDDGSKLTYNCKSGYTASKTDEELTCNTNTWSPSAPTLTCTSGNGAEKTLTGGFSLLIMTVTMMVFYF